MTSRASLDPSWLPRLGVGAWSDLAVNLLTGSTVEDHGDHLVVRTESDPTYIWGNHLLVFDEVNDADRWIAAFADAFPTVTHVAIGFAQAPTDEAAWRRRGVELHVEEPLIGAAPRSAVPEGVEVRPVVTDAQWEELIEIQATQGEDDTPTQRYLTFTRGRWEARRPLSESGQALFLGAWVDDRLVGHVGIIDCGPVARYQNVVTRSDYRRRGIASHLVGECSAWAVERGYARQVIMADEGSVAARMYADLGFVADREVVGGQRV